MDAHIAPTKTHWLLVDDNEDILRMLSAILKKISGAVIECFASPQAAFAAFAAAPGKYGLVITDFEMPEMDGVELCRRMRAVVPAQTIFLATGSGFFTESVARHAGFAALLNKPVPLTALRAALTAAGIEVEKKSLATETLHSNNKTTNKGNI